MRVAVVVVDVLDRSELVRGTFEGTRNGGEIRGTDSGATGTVGVVMGVAAVEEDAWGGAENDDVAGYRGKSSVSILGENVAVLGTEDDARRLRAGARLNEGGAPVLETGVVDSREAAAR